MRLDPEAPARNAFEEYLRKTKDHREDQRRHGYRRYKTLADLESN